MTCRTPPGALYPAILGLLEAKRPFALATVLEADHSTPVKAGAKALIEPDGTIYGTVGGGAVEARAQREARLTARTGKPVVFDFDLLGPGVHEPSPICGGFMRLLVAPASSASARDYHRAAEALARRERGVWLTELLTRADLKVGSRFVRETDLKAQARSPALPRLRSCLRQEEPELFQVRRRSAHQPVEVFVEPVVPQPVLVIIGGGHVGQAVAAQASLLGFEIELLEDRPEFADPGLFPPGTKTHCGPVAERLAQIPVDADTFIVLVSRGHQQDSAALRACIHRPAGYIGMIGSRRKVPLVRQQFLKSGWATRAEFDRVYAPIGLDIGAVTVPEIAASVVAQIVAVRRTGSAPGMPLK